MMKVNLFFDETIRLSQDYKDMKASILILSAMWGLLGGILGFWLILKMK